MDHSEEISEEKTAPGQEQSEGGHQLEHLCTVEDLVPTLVDTSGLEELMIDGITYKPYVSELQMPSIVQLMKASLSEPYSIYTYRYFIHKWPQLCKLAVCNGECVGAIVCKLEFHHYNVRRGYIAMLAVAKDFRRKKIG